MTSRDPRAVAAKAWKIGRGRVGAAKHHALERAGRPPVVVFSWSKTGSSSAFDTLRRSHLRRPVYHVHELDDAVEDRLAVNAATGDNLGLHPRELQAVRRLRSQLAAGDVRFSLVTLVRDPMSRAISSFFQRHHSTGIDMTRPSPEPEAVQATVDLLHEHLPALIRSTDAWFDRQMVAVFGLDLFDQPFDVDLGYACYREERFDQAVLRLDRFGSVYRDALEPLLGRSVGPVRQLNISSSKRYEAHRRATLELFRATPDEIDLAAGSRVLQHYFAPHERDALVRGWRREG